MENNVKLMKVLATGRKVVVQYVAKVNNVRYYVQANRPERVYTSLEVRDIKPYR